MLSFQAESSKSAKGSSPAVTKSLSGAASSPGAASAKAVTPEFRLTSMERHQKAQEELARKVGLVAAQLLPGVNR